MKQLILRCASLAALAAALAAPASAGPSTQLATAPSMSRGGELKLSMQDGRVTIYADNVPLRQILQEWARVGQTKIVNAEKLTGPNVTILLVNVTEREALDVILRSASGYIAAPRPTPVAGAATFDRITIFVSSKPAPTQNASAAPPPTFQRPPQPDDSDEPINVTMPPQMVNSPANAQYPGMPPTMPPTNLPPQLQQLQQMQQMQQNQGLPAPGMSPLTAPRPGALPQPALPAGVPNPYQPVVRPGGPGGPGGPRGPGGQL